MLCTLAAGDEGRREWLLRCGVLPLLERILESEERISSPPATLKPPPPAAAPAGVNGSAIAAVPDHEQQQSTLGQLEEIGNYEEVPHGRETESSTGAMQVSGCRDSGFLGGSVCV